MSARFENSMITNKDELIHPIQTDNWDWIETSWFGVTHLEPTPGRHIMIWPYIHMRMTAGVAWEGIAIWEGIKETQAAAEYIDFRMWAPIPKGQDFDEKGITFINGLGVRAIIPGEKYQIDFVDKARDTEVHFTWTAVSQRFPWITDNHFDQVGRVQGTLKLRAEKFDFDTYNIRDRGWAPRNDAPVVKGPSFDYIAGVLDEKNAFGIFGFDQKTLQLGSTAKPTFSAQVEDAEFLPTSWILKDGVAKEVRRFDLEVTRDTNKWRPVHMDAVVTDEDNDKHEVHIDIVGYLPILFPYNNITASSTARGTWDGRPYIGKWDESLDNDVLNFLIKGKN